MNTQLGSKQRGAIALIITLILVVIASLSSLVVNKSAIEEQKRSGIDLRNKEVYAAANGALEYGIYELMRLYNDKIDADTMNTATPAWDTTDAGGTAVASYDPYGDGSVTTLAQGIDAFTPAITYTLLTAEGEQPAVIEITAPVVGVAETHVNKTVSVRVMRANLGTPSLFNGPPLIVEDCIPAGAVTGTPDVRPLGNGGVAIATITGSTADTSCLDPGHFTVDNDGVVGEPLSDDPNLDLFTSMFAGYSEATLQDAAAVSDDVYFITSTSPWSTDLGSLSNPVILYFAEEAECPAINGGAIIYGTVYYAAPDGGCANPGPGNAKIFGTMAFEGDLNQLNANVELIGVDYSNADGTDTSISIISVLPGSWRDF
ncbi:hypothetical protein A9Q90_05980 [Gammaproteobacteria bacterium 54_18_T64]|nr:hypothetical protein A9Q90_05980 [Gammaproteobacteria bacterium 54_18_T64]